MAIQCMPVSIYPSVCLSISLFWSLMRLFPLRWTCFINNANITNGCCPVSAVGGKLLTWIDPVAIPLTKTVDGLHHSMESLFVYRFNASLSLFMWSAVYLSRSLFCSLVCLFVGLSGVHGLIYLNCTAVDVSKILSFDGVIRFFFMINDLYFQNNLCYWLPQSD